MRRRSLPAARAARVATAARAVRVATVGHAAKAQAAVATNEDDKKLSHSAEIKKNLRLE